MKSKRVAYLLWFFLGIFSAHRFYLGRFSAHSFYSGEVGTGILYLLTFQLFGIGWLIDLFTLRDMVDTYNRMQRFGTPNSATMNQQQHVLANRVASEKPVLLQATNRKLNFIK